MALTWPRGNTGDEDEVAGVCRSASLPSYKQDPISLSKFSIYNLLICIAQRRQCPSNSSTLFAFPSLPVSLDSHSHFRAWPALGADQMPTPSSHQSIVATPSSHSSCPPDDDRSSWRSIEMDDSHDEAIVTAPEVLQQPTPPPSDSQAAG